MYTEQVISTLINRIGWDKSLNSETNIIVDSVNMTATSERKVNTFHSLASVENIYSAVSEVNMTQVKFNEFLFSIKMQSVREVVSAMLDQHHLYDETFDYSSVILSKVRLFDDPIGYTIAIKILELFVASARINATERSNSMSFQMLKVELEGAKNENGHLVAKGIIAKKELVIRKAQRILFPDPITIQSISLW